MDADRGRRANQLILQGVVGGAAPDERILDVGRLSGSQSCGITIGRITAEQELKRWTSLHRLAPGLRVITCR